MATTKNNIPGEFSGGGPIRTALIRGETFSVKSVQYVEMDGLAMFEGDIVLGTIEEVERMSEMLRAESASGVARGVAISGAQYRWPNCRIPYTIESTLPNQTRVTNAIAHWESNTNFQFVARTAETDYVTFRKGSGCSSSVGKRGGQQFVNLASGCSTGNVIHEIGHVVGLWHEQSREDRDLFVTINWDKIKAGYEHNFNQHITDGDDIGVYDFGSIMHYPLDAFSVDGSNTMSPIATVAPGVTIGQRSALSAGDIAATRTLCGIVKTVKEGSKDPLKEIPSDTRKELVKDIRLDTRKELIKDIRLDTRKELISDTLKEQIRDTLKEGRFDPGPTIAENLVTPGRAPVSQPISRGGGMQPFVVVTPQAGEAAPSAKVGLEEHIAQLDMQLQQIADELVQTEAAKETLQAQYNETSALLEQMIQQLEQASE